jgi:excisionase family DNA binding protein
MKIAEVAGRLDVTYAAVHRRIKDKTLGMRVTRFGSEWRVNRSDFERRYGDDGSAVIAA